MSNPKVSVVIPIYNVENYIEKCAESLFKQTLRDVEFIFVNDCTPDKSMEKLVSVLDKYPERKKQVYIINHVTNLGAAKARKNGILAATGEYVIHCDSDDWTNVQLYETLYKKAKTENLDAVICEFYTMYGSKPKAVRQHLGVNPLSTIISKPLLCSLINKLVRRTIFTDNNIIFPDNHMMEDGALCAQIFYFAKRIGYVNQPLYYYRIVSSVSLMLICRIIVVSLRFKSTYVKDDIIYNLFKQRRSGYSSIHSKQRQAHYPILSGCLYTSKL